MPQISLKILQDTIPINWIMINIVSFVKVGHNRVAAFYFPPSPLVQASVYIALDHIHGHTVCEWVAEEFAGHLLIGQQVSIPTSRSDVTARDWLTVAYRYFWLRVAVSTGQTQ